MKATKSQIKIQQFDLLKAKRKKNDEILPHFLICSISTLVICFFTFNNGVTTDLDPKPLWDPATTLDKTVIYNNIETNELHINLRNKNN